MALQPMYPAIANSPQTELAADITADDTTIPVLNAAALPPAPNLAVIGSDEMAETVLYTGIDGNNLTGVTRGFQGAAKAWVQGTKVARNFTAYDYDALRENLEDHASATTGVHGATSAATPNTIVQRDEQGRIKAAAPASSDDVARKAETDAALAAAQNAQATADAALPRSGGTVAGPLVVEGPLERVGTAPNLILTESNAGPNEKIWELLIQSGVLKFLVYDDNLQANPFLIATRSGAMITSVNLIGNQILANGNQIWDTSQLRYNGVLEINLGGVWKPIPVLTGSGSPEGVVTAPVGFLYLRTDGGAATTLYVKESGTGNTGWVAK